MDHSPLREVLRMYCYIVLSVVTWPLPPTGRPLQFLIQKPPGERKDIWSKTLWFETRSTEGSVRGAAFRSGFCFHRKTRRYKVDMSHKGMSMCHVGLEGQRGVHESCGRRFTSSLQRGRVLRAWRERKPGGKSSMLDSGGSTNYRYFYFA